MIEQLILLSGPIAVGKTTLATGLVKEHNFAYFNTRSILEKRLKVSLRYDRRNLQSEGDLLDKETNGYWVAEELRKYVSNIWNAHSIVVDSVRIQEQVMSVRALYGEKVKHIHLTASLKTLEHRYEQRNSGKQELQIPYQELKQNKTENDIERLAKSADFAVDTDSLTVIEVLDRVLKNL